MLLELLLRMKVSRDLLLTCNVTAERRVVTAVVLRKLKQSIVVKLRMKLPRIPESLSHVLLVFTSLLFGLLLQRDQMIMSKTITSLMALMTKLRKTTKRRKRPITWLAASFTALAVARAARRAETSPSPVIPSLFTVADASFFLSSIHGVRQLLPLSPQTSRDHPLLQHRRDQPLRHQLPRHLRPRKHPS
jgi:hypothetical protein